METINPQEWKKDLPAFKEKELNEKKHEYTIAKEAV